MRVVLRTQNSVNRQKMHQMQARTRVRFVLAVSNTLSPPRGYEERWLCMQNHNPCGLIVRELLPKKGPAPFQIEIVPLGLMRGRSFHNSFIIADECQNASYDQLKMLLTRIGMESKMVLTGDTAQSDLHRSQQGGFLKLIDVLSDVPKLGVSYLDSSDIIRNSIITDIVQRLEEYEHERTP